MIDNAKINSLFVELTKAHWNAVLRFAYSLSGKKENAEDLLQITLLKSLKAFPKFLQDNQETYGTTSDVLLKSNEQFNLHLKNWLYKITKNSYLDEISALKHWQLEQYSELDSKSSNINFSANYEMDTLENAATIAGNSKDNKLKNDENTFYHLALDDEWEKKIYCLSSKQRSILYLITEGFSYKEISSTLDIPIGTVMSSLSRAVQKLRN